MNNGIVNGIFWTQLPRLLNINFILLLSFFPLEEKILMIDLSEIILHKFYSLIQVRNVCKRSEPESSAPILFSTSKQTQKNFCLKQTDVFHEKYLNVFICGLSHKTVCSIGLCDILPLQIGQRILKKRFIF